MKSTTAQACGKVIWMGEHAAVYGYKALALPLREATVTITLTPSFKASLTSPFYQGLIEHIPALFQPIQALYYELTAFFNTGAFQVDVETTFPLAAGLGSSAAMAAALTKAFYQAHGVPYDQKNLYDWIQRSESLAHGQASGVDASVISLEQPILFQKNQPSQPLEFQCESFLLVAYSEHKGHTKEAVEKIQAQSHDPQTQHHLRALGALSESFIAAMPFKQPERIGRMMTQAHEHLKALGVSHATLDTMVDTALKHGALGAKLSGGGLGGCMIALIPEAPVLHKIQKAFHTQGWQRQWVLTFKGAAS